MAQRRHDDLQSVGTWRVVQRLGEGSFGSVYCVTKKKKGQKINHKRDSYAMKVERRQESRYDEVLRMEIHVLELINELGDKRFFATIEDKGRTPEITYVVMTLLGKPLDDLRRLQPKRRLSTVSVLKIGIQMMSAFSKLHRTGFVHRDVKPANMAPGYQQSKMIYLFDFGLARYIYKDRERTRLKPPRKRASFRGTYRYCSANAHKEREQGPVDDLWGLLYSLIELCTGNLPWRGIRPSESLRIKENTPSQTLFRDCPPSFIRIKRQLARLEYSSQPDYVYFEELLFHDLNNDRNQLAVPFEWEKQPQQNDIFAAPRESNSNGNGEEDGQAKRNEGDSETIRTVDSVFSSGVHADTNNAGSQNETVDDTLDDVPSIYRQQTAPPQTNAERTRTKQQQQPPQSNNTKPASKTRGGKDSNQQKEQKDGSHQSGKNSHQKEKKN